MLDTLKIGHASHPKNKTIARLQPLSKYYTVSGGTLCFAKGDGEDALIDLAGYLRPSCRFVDSSTLMSRGIS